MDLNNCFKYYDELYEDLQNIILSKVRNPQNKNLLEDITNYKISKICIFKQYEKIGYEYNDDYTDDFNIYSIIDNDLMSFWNDDIAYMLKITDKNYNKMLRQLAFKIKNNNNSSIAIYNFHKNSNILPKTKINRYLAGLTVEERQDFISIIINN